MDNINGNKEELPPEQREELLKALKARFKTNMNRQKVLSGLNRLCPSQYNSTHISNLSLHEHLGKMA
jgi:hypothetical protein